MAKKRHLRIATFLVLGMVTGRLGTFSQPTFAANGISGDVIGANAALPISSESSGAAVIPAGEIAAPIINNENSAQVLPRGGEVVGGSATITTLPQLPSHLFINQTSEHAIIEWETFNIGIKEITEFAVPNPSSITLNRVVGGSPSEILGTLKSNGHVWLINPNGVLFGKDVALDVSGLLVTGSNISNEHFMNNVNNKYDFTVSENDTSIINQGKIKVKDTGMVVLVAPYVRNNGTIEAKVGKIYTNSGTTFTLDFYGDDLIHFQAGQANMLQPAKSMLGQTPLQDAVRNSGKLIAEGGKIVMSTQHAKRVVENLINMDGVIKADSAVVKNGEIYLYGAGKGTVRVLGKINDGLGIDKGGKITITGDDKVFVYGRANINTSGDFGGGEIFIGGDYQGLGKTPQAKITFIGKEVTINANAKVKGEGGTVVAWSNKQAEQGSTIAWGSFSAKGGTMGGKGGTIETSGAYLDTQGIKIDAKGGEWLLDPYNVSISDVSVNGAFVLDPSTGEQVWTPGPAPAVLSIVNRTNIETFLNAGTNVRIATEGPVPGTQDGDINITSAITTTGNGVALTLESSRDININANITGITGAGLTLVLLAPNLIRGNGGGAIGDVNVMGLQVSAAGFDVGAHPPLAPTSFVNADPSGTNIVALTQVTAGTFLFNGNILSQFISSPTPTPTPNPNPPPSSINPTDAGLPGTGGPSFPPGGPGDQLITVEPTPPPQPPTPSPTPPTPSEPSPPPSTPETPPPAPPEVPPSPPPTPEAPPTAEPGPPLGGPGGEDFPGGGDEIGGLPEGHENPTTVEGAGGKEGVAEGAFDPENINKAEEVPAVCPMNIERYKGVIPPECPEKPKGPVRATDIAGLGRGDKNALVGPEGVNGIDVPTGSAGIGLVGEELEGLQREATAVAEGREVMRSEWSQEDINRAPEYLEHLAPVGFKEKVSFWSKIKAMLNRAPSSVNSEASG